MKTEFRKKNTLRPLSACRGSYIPPNKANSSDTEAPFLDLDLSLTNGIVSCKIYDKLIQISRH